MKKLLFAVLALLPALCQADLTVGFTPIASDPYACSTSKRGEAYWNTTAGELKVCDGTAWRGSPLRGSAGTADSLTASELAQGSVGTDEILDATITTTDLSATAGVLRTQLAEDALQPYPVPLTSLRAADLGALVVSETAGDHYIVVSTADIILRGEVADDETEASVSYFQIPLPPGYVAAGDVTITVTSKTAVVAAGGATNGSTIDLEVFEINQTTGAAGSDIGATAAQAINGTAAADTFTVTATNLVAGDILNVRLTTSVIENDGSTGTIQAEVYSIVLKADIKG